MEETALWMWTSYGRLNDEAKKFACGLSSLRQFVSLSSLTVGTFGTARSQNINIIQHEMIGGMSPRCLSRTRRERESKKRWKKSEVHTGKEH